jgi:hypothetical protein
MIARALPVTSTTAVRTINTGVFIATSLLRGPRASQSDYRGSNEPTVNAARAAMTSSAHQRFNLAGGLRCELAAVGYREISLQLYREACSGAVHAMCSNRSGGA